MHLLSVPFKEQAYREKKLTQEEVRQEVIALQDLGHKRLALEAGEDPVNNPIEYILECIDTIYSIKHKNGEIRRVNVNIAATTVENYRKLKEAGIGTYILFQETYHKKAIWSYIRPDQNTTMATILPRWTVQWKQVLMMSESVCCSVLTNTAMNLQDF